MKIAVIDGQGGGIGRVLVEKIRKAFGDKVEIWAFGTNSAATALMLKAGADEGATGENAIVNSMGKVDIIVGTVAILAANSMLGELTPAMAAAVADSSAAKVLLPINRGRITIVGAKTEPLPHMADCLVKQLQSIIEKEV
ncbi:hypothetical protein Tfer_0186 [Thermincola ferriacetica]|uniref:DUF3842 family protein n=2 Tax=Thermincola TaxID=278993 RepID=D5XEM0_THEPJ|nr:MULTISPECIES: DUF3842 family protein [Thermincola]ADG82091.1 conserved hypothetical protein [Thermincola potens JR]KNZ71110.1 hypothetical protein Tfer_0186 [Thermincola ferriacetica]